MSFSRKFEASSYGEYRNTSRAYIDPYKKGKDFPVHAMKAQMKEKMYSST